MKDKKNTYLSSAIGRRKTAVARIYLKKGSGQILVNHRKFEEYFNRSTERYVVVQPLNLLNTQKDFDLNINVFGGGTTGQAGAIRLALSRALLKLDVNHKDSLKKAGFLTRDSRKVERKKYGLAGARKAFQFSKR